MVNLNLFCQILFGYKRLILLVFCFYFESSSFYKKLCADNFIAFLMNNFISFLSRRI